MSRGGIKIRIPEPHPYVVQFVDNYPGTWRTPPPSPDPVFRRFLEKLQVHQAVYSIWSTIYKDSFFSTNH